MKMICRLHTRPISVLASFGTKLVFVDVSYLKIEIKFNRFTMPVLMNQVGPIKEVPDHGVLLWCLHVILFQDSNQNGIETNTDGSRDKNKVAAAAVIIKDVCFLLDSQMRRLNFFQQKQRQLNLLLSI